MRKTSRSICALTAFILLTTATAGHARPPETTRLSAVHDRPLAFEENRGQTDLRVKYLSRGQGYTLFLTPAQAVLALRGNGTDTPVLRMRWAGGAADPRITADGPLPGASHYLLGKDPSRWQRNVPSWTRVHYDEVWPGIDLVFYGNPRQLEHDVVVAPGADPEKVRLAFDGADELRIEETGDLMARVGGEEIRLRRPVSYQGTGGARQEVESAWRLLPGTREAGFRVGAYDRAQPLLIDPVLAYSSYFGGQHQEFAGGVVTDAQGNAWVAGGSLSADYPDWSGRRPTGEDAFVMKVSSLGELLSLTYLGGSGHDAATDVALDGRGYVYLTGRTQSSDFPRVRPWQPPFPEDTYPWQWDTFAVKLDPAAAHYVYSGNLGGNFPDFGSTILADAQGRAWVAGTTESTDFPQVRPLPLPRAVKEFPEGDAFVTQIAADGAEILFSTYIGGSGEDSGGGMDLDPAGFVYLTGSIGYSPDFPLVRPLGPLQVDIEDAFAVKFDSATSSFVYSTPLGGSFIDGGSDVAARPDGSAWFVGSTESDDFPTTPDAVQRLRNGTGTGWWSDVYATRLDRNGALVYSTLLGGSGQEFWPSVALGPGGAVHVMGATGSSDFPLRDPIQAECAPATGENQCEEDLFITKLSAGGTRIDFSTFLGGREKPEGRFHPAQDLPGGIAVDPRGNIHVVGYTYSTDFPTLNALQDTYGGGLNALLAKISFKQKK